MQDYVPEGSPDYEKARLLAQQKQGGTRDYIPEGEVAELQDVPCSCPECGYRATDDVGLENHINRQHPGYVSRKEQKKRDEAEAAKKQAEIDAAIAGRSSQEKAEEARLVEEEARKAEVDSAAGAGTVGQNDAETAPEGDPDASTVTQEAEAISEEVEVSDNASGDDTTPASTRKKVVK